MQFVFEKTVDHLLKILKRKSNLKTENIVLAGGLAMNCVYNGKLLKNKTYKKVLYLHAQMISEFQLVPFSLHNQK